MPLALLPPAFPASRGATWVVRRAPGGAGTRGLLETGGAVHPCVLGRGGISVRKREGDGATPAGPMRVIGGYRNPKRFRLRYECAQLLPASPALGWCDAPQAASYNRPVRLPARSRAESMLREDRLYDICLVLDWNTGPRVRHRGSAIFLHQTSLERKPTAGCIALDPALLRRLLARLRGRRIVMTP